MAYQKKRKYSKRRYYKKKSKGLGDYTLSETANFAARGVKSIMRIINVEYKHYNTIRLPATVSNTGLIMDLSDIAIGDASSNRDGISVKPLNLNLRTHSYIDPASAHCFVRAIVFRGKQEAGVAPVVSDVLEATTGVGAVLSQKNIDKRFKTKILSDKLIKFTPNNPTTITKENIRLEGHINYDIGDSTGASKENGGLYLLLIGSAATNLPTMTVYSALSYTDN